MTPRRISVKVITPDDVRMRWFDDQFEITSTDGAITSTAQTSPIVLNVGDYSITIDTRTGRTATVRKIGGHR